MTDFDSLFVQAKKAHPVAMSGRLGGLLPQTPKQQQTQGDAQPVYTGLSNILSLPNTPGGMAGAMMRDLAAGRKVGGDQPRGSRTAESHFLESLTRNPTQAINEYFATSPQSMREYSKGTGPLASVGSYFVKHPRQNAALDFFGRILDPGNRLTGGAVEAGSTLLGTGVRTAARATAKKVVERAPTMAASDLVKHLNTAEHLGSFNRFGDVRSGAEDIARSRGIDPKLHGDAAEVAARNLANATRYADGMSQRAANQVFKGLTNNEQFELVHMIEGESPLMGKRLSPAQQALKTKLMPRLEAYRTWRHRLDTATVRFNVADTSRLLRGENFFSRVGLLKNAEEDADELPENEAFRERFGGGGSGPSKGTLSQNIHRRYRSLREAIRNRESLAPDASPMRAFEMHVFARTQAARINEQLDKLQELGMIVPKEQPVPLGLGITTPSQKPPGYVDVADLGSLKQYGSSITRNAYVHPSVAYLINDVGSQVGARNVLSSILSIGGKTLSSANRLLSTVEVSNPIYHPAFNISENIVSEQPAVSGLIKGATSKAAIEKAEDEGVHVPFARRQAAHEWGRPWSDLSPQEKLRRALLAAPHGVESVASKPLYESIEPRMATGAYEGLKPRLGPSGANLAVRSIVGEPENIGAAERNVAPLAQFPAWLKSQLRRWPAAAAKRPWLYNAPHAAVRDINAAKGRGPRPGDESKFIPPIVLGRDKNGDAIVLNIPHPGNRAAAIGAALANRDPHGLGFAFAGAANPLLQAPAYGAMQTLSSSQKRDLASVAPAESPLEKVLGYAKGFAYFSPVRSFTAKELTPEHQEEQRQLIDAFLYGRRGRNRTRGLVEIRADQRKAERAGDTAAADRLRIVGDAMYRSMLQTLGSKGFAVP